jgi:hypothetical protein
MAQLNTPYAVLSFPRLFAPKERAPGDGNPVYSCSLLFAPSDQKSPEYKKMQEAVLTAAREKFGANVNVKSLVLPFRDAGEKDYEGYDDGVVYISPWSSKRPGIVDSRLQDVLDADEVFAGQVVRANVTPFAWSNTGRKGVSFGLNHIQIIKKDAPRIDGRIAANKAFSAIEDGGDEDRPF